MKYTGIPIGKPAETDFLTRQEKEPKSEGRSGIDTAIAVGAQADIITPLYGLIRQVLTGGQGVILPTVIWQQYDIAGILKRHGINTWAYNLTFSGDEIIFSADTKRDRVYDILLREIGDK